MDGYHVISKSNAAAFYEFMKELAFYAIYSIQDQNDTPKVVKRGLRLPFMKSLTGETTTDVIDEAFKEEMVYQLIDGIVFYYDILVGEEDFGAPIEELSDRLEGYYISPSDVDMGKIEKILYDVSLQYLGDRMLG